MNFGWFDVPTVLHEFGHALGMVHEHDNPRNNDIHWNKPVVYSYMSDHDGWDKQTVDKNIFARYSIQSINGSSYDECSIMSYFFPSNFTTNGKGSHQNLRLSPLDCAWIVQQYSDDRSSSTLTEKSKNVAKKYYKEWYGVSFDQGCQGGKKKVVKCG